MIKDRLLRIYGRRVGEVLELCSRDAALLRPLRDDAEALAGEVVFSFENELARTLADCLLRRTMLGLNSDLAIGDDEAAAEIGKRFLGWSNERVVDELSAYRAYVDRLQMK